jgi:hypothetical protein
MTLAQAQACHATMSHTTVTPRSRIRPILARITKHPESARQLAERITSFAANAEGRQVGNGECYTLADQALASAGARSAPEYSDVTPNGDYVWGTPVAPEAALPGDILQFRNFRIVRRVTTLAVSLGGSINSMHTEEVEERDHHTAIVARNLRGALTILEQNTEPLGRVVQRTTIEIATGRTSRIDPDTGVQTVTDVYVEGTVRAYRPQRAENAVVADAGAQPDD